MLSNLASISSEQLVTVTGGNAANPQVCTPDNPTGQRPTQYFERNNAAPPPRELPNPAHGNFFTNPRDLGAKSRALADRLRGQ